VRGSRANRGRVRNRPAEFDVLAVGELRDRVSDVDDIVGLLSKTRDAMKPAAEAADAEVVERAMRFYLGRRALETSQAMSGLSEEDAMRLADEELHAMRRERRREQQQRGLARAGGGVSADYRALARVGENGR